MIGEHFYWLRRPGFPSQWHCEHERRGVGDEFSGASGSNAVSYGRQSQWPSHTSKDNPYKALQMTLEQIATSVSTLPLYRSYTFMKILLFASTVFFVLLIGPLENVQSFEMPKFKIIWKMGSTYGVLVDRKFSDSQVSKMVYELREIRKRNEFHKFFPVTAPGLKDQYAMFQIRIFSDPQWATEKLAKDYVNGEMSKEVEQEYINNIRGYYGWQSNVNFETGEIGYSEGKLKSKNYRKLFSSHF